MKKLKLTTILMLLSIGVFAQLPLEVEKKLKVSGNDTTEVETSITRISVKLKSRSRSIKLLMENVPMRIAVRTKKLKVTNIKYTGDDIFALTIFTCESQSLGIVIVEEELKTMSSIIKIDKDRDGISEEIFVLKN